ncbi:uncharacterized protein [Watersipora subatra]|uniref:uncharacterized protein n=1 Tax=Watersipora subatra TaxID=2589382 RepID=UPI00355B3848
MQRKPGETVQELAARIRQDATTCDFTSITNPLDEAMRTKFIFSVSNEAVLKALFKVKVELSFTRAVELATETEDAAKVAKKTAHGSKATGVNKVQSEKKPAINRPSGSSSSASQRNRPPPSSYRCGKNHLANTCVHKNSQCNFCNKLGHIEPACRTKKNATSNQLVKIIKSTTEIKTVKRIASLPQLQQQLKIKDTEFTMKLDTGACENFITTDVWKKLDKPTLEPIETQYESASKHLIHVLGQFQM